jgi:hypothetical protein
MFITSEIIASMFYQISFLLKIVLSEMSTFSTLIQYTLEIPTHIHKKKEEIKGIQMKRK